MVVPGMPFAIRGKSSNNNEYHHFLLVPRNALTLLDLLPILPTLMSAETNHGYCITESRTRSYHGQDNSKNLRRMRGCPLRMVRLPIARGEVVPHRHFNEASSGLVASASLDALCDPSGKRKARFERAINTMDSPSITQDYLDLCHTYAQEIFLGYG